MVVPTYRRPEALRECLQALASQELADLDVIVVNDGGPSVAAVVAAAPLPVRLVELPQNIGHPAARNQAIPLALGRYLCLCDDDDLLLPPHLRAAVTLLESGYDLVYSDVELVTFAATPTQRIAVAAHPLACDFDPEFLRRWNFIPVSAAVYRRSLHETLGPLDPDLGHYFDWDWWLRVVTAGNRIRRIPMASAVIAVDAGGANQSADPQRMRSDLERLIRRHRLGNLPSSNYLLMLAEPEVRERQAETRRLRPWSELGPNNRSSGPPIPG